MHISVHLSDSCMSYWEHIDTELVLVEFCSTLFTSHLSALSQRSPQLDPEQGREVGEKAAI